MIIATAAAADVLKIAFLPSTGKIGAKHLPAFRVEAGEDGHTAEKKRT